MPSIRARTPTCRSSVCFGDLTESNGLIGSPDGATLYITDIGAWKTFAFDIQQDGTLKN